MTEHTLSLLDSLTIIEGLARSGNNMKIAFTETIIIVAVLDSAYFIVRAGDTAFIRTNYP